MITFVLKKQNIVVQKITMVQAVYHVQDIQIKFAIIMGNVKELVQGREMAVVYAIKDMLGKLVHNVLQDTMSLTKMKRLCCVQHAMWRVMDLAKVLGQRIVRNVQMDGT